MIPKKFYCTFPGYICSTDKILVNSQCNLSTPSAGSGTDNFQIPPCKVKNKSDCNIAMLGVYQEVLVWPEVL